ncbi:methylamine utilization protein [Photobacterium sanctipauli]|uniref:Methylamine utilization protein n=1 Tax=Photobacterium sanctipauli TaxID=1342794 RepID=A0A2T3P165_9GAMM|nr:cytochrome c peroxidase [Photobacterium sanctipauli]PSW22254.1 methylamine utilization protein [Photobacterium sanctipauli]
MNTSRYLLAVVILASVTACRDDSSDDEISSVAAASGDGEQVAESTNEPEASPEPEAPDGDGNPPAPEPTPEPEPEPEPEPKLDIDGLPMPDLSVTHDYEAYLAARPNYYTRLSAPFGSVDGQDNTPFGNPVTNEGANLGRVIFYDVRLSANNTVACADCHIQKHGFTDPKVFSDGFDGGKTGRHSMSLSNATYYRNGKFFWDERADTLEDQVLMPIQDPVEMGMNLFDLEVKMAETSFYGPLFEQVFGDDAITSERIALAMAQFIRTMVSYESKYDQAFDADWNEPDFESVFTEQEMLGLKLFSGFPGPERDSLGCVACHTTTAHSMDQAHVNGLIDRNAADQGAGNGFFKSPSLRNIEVGAPYMHDGSLATLEDVVEFYNSGIKRHPSLSPDLTSNGQPGGPAIRMGLNEEEKAALVAFMKTLTDEAFLANPIFESPFEERAKETGDNDAPQGDQTP